MEKYFWIINVLALFVLVYFFLVVKYKGLHFKKIGMGIGISFIASIALISTLKIKIDPIEKKKEIFISDIRTKIKENKQLNEKQAKLIELLLTIPQKSLKFSYARGSSDDVIRAMTIITKLNYLDNGFCNTAFSNEYPINSKFFTNIDTLSADDYEGFVKITSNSLLNQVLNPQLRSAFNEDLFIKQAYSRAKWKLSKENRDIFQKLLSNLDNLSSEQKCSLVKLVYISGENLPVSEKAAFYLSFFDFYRTNQG